MDLPPAARPSAATSPVSPQPPRAGSTDPRPGATRAGSPLGRPFAGILAASRPGGARGIPCSGGSGSPARRAPQHADTGRAEGAGPEAVEGQTGSRSGEGAAENGGGNREGNGPHDQADDLELLDPAARHAASLAPPALPSAIPTHASEAPLRARSLEELLPALVRRIAWAGDKHRGTVRLELGAGAYAGTTVIVHADDGRVRVEISGTEGPELDRLRARLDGRLRGRGLDVESVT